METASWTSTFTEPAHDVGRVESKQRREQVRAVGQARGVLVDHFDLIALQDRHVDVLRQFVAAMVLDHHQPGLGDFNDAAMPGQRPGRAPHQGRLSRRNAEMNAGSFDCRTDSDQA